MPFNLILFYVFAAVAVGATLLVVVQSNAVYSVLLLIASFIGLALVWGARELVNLVAGVGTTSIMVDDNGTAAGGNVTEVATLSGTHTVVAILFDDAQAPTDVA